MAQHSQRLDTLTAKVAALENKEKQKVAFSAHFSTHPVTNLAAGSTLKFDAVDVNIGNGYDAAIGIFRAPYAGVYVFNIKVLSNNNYSCRLDIVTTPNNHIITTTEVWPYQDRQTATGQSLVHLQQGQSVWVVGFPIGGPDAIQIYGDIFTAFSGFLLYSD